MATTTVEAFSITACAVLSPTGSQAAQLYGCKEGQLTADVTTSDMRNDDWYVGTWSNIKTVTISINAGFISFAALAYISGNQVISSAGAPDNYYATALWSAYGANTRPVPMVIRANARDSAGTAGTLDIVLFAVQLYGIEPAGIQYKQGLTAAWGGRAVPSWYDDLGNRLTEQAFGRLIAWATPHTSFPGAIGTVYQVTSSDTATAADNVKTSGVPAFRVNLSSADTASSTAQTERLARSAITSNDTATGTEAAAIGIVGVGDQDSASAQEGQRAAPIGGARAVCAGQGAISASPSTAMAGKWASSAYGQLSAKATVVPSGLATLPGAASMSGTGQVTGAVRASYSAVMSGTGTLSAGPRVQTRPPATMSGSATLYAVYAGSGTTSIYVDPGTPPPNRFQNVAGLTKPSAWFAPAAGSLVAVAVVWMWTVTSTNDSLSVSDSQGRLYEPCVPPLTITGAGQNVSLGIFCNYYPATPGSLQVSAANSVGTVSSVELVVRVLDGAAANQASAATATDSTDGNITINTTQDYSWVLVACGNAANSTGGLINTSSVLIDFWSDPTSGDDAGISWLQTGAHGSYACGMSNMTRSLAVEYLTA